MARTGFYQSSLTKKYVMALAGLFLITFLFVHLGINLLVLCKGSANYEARELFNIAAHFMGTNVLIKIFEVVLFGGFIIHIIYGFVLQIQNWMARPKRYKKENFSFTSPFSKFMIHTGIIIFIFLIIHLFDFYFKAKIYGDVKEVIYDGKHYHDLGLLVIDKFQHLGFVIFYVVILIFLGFHLHHAFQSVFQSLGLNHPRYMPVLKTISLIISIILPLGFMIIPLVIYFGNY
ncbi:MAG: succinate dehydrogenase cytochrome b subunit [Bacteroidales bacterium]|nr:succinate dehydrogenase cytochrome b subunit [Bacteroidales bacterium]MCF8386926.1 succinate dehydrogenase cytochrome b subunit [Bacteroidales bacterium]MCF8399353.1 succinate dehydrogenase cytochrome b subunit [Bacteroidales bacterium]